MKTRLVIFLILLLFVICFTACESDEDNRDRIFLEADADVTAFRDQLPLILPYDLAESSEVKLYLLDTYGDTITYLVDDVMNAGMHRVLIDLSENEGNGVYCVKFDVVEGDTLINIGQRIYSIASRKFSSDFKQYADDHFDIEKYKDYEFLAAVYSDHSVAPYQGTRSEWFELGFDERIAYLPYHFKGDMQDTRDDRFYSVIADFPEQFGCGWDDAVNTDDYEFSGYIWAGFSIHMGAYLEMYEDYQD